MGYFTLMNDTVQVLRAPVVEDAYHSQTRNWSAATVVATGLAAVQPGFSDENSDDRQTTISTWRLISDSTDLYGILPTDRILWQGKTFEVDSEASMWRWRNADHHIEVNLREVHG